MSMPLPVPTTSTSKRSNNNPHNVNDAPLGSNKPFNADSFFGDLMPVMVRISLWVDFREPSTAGYLPSCGFRNLLIRNPKILFCGQNEHTA
jgi:hypothetical protein